MSLNQEIEPSSSVLKICLENYEKGLRDTIVTQDYLGTDYLHQEHAKILSTATNGFSDEDKSDLWEFFYERWYNIVEQEEEQKWQNSGNYMADENVCVYLTRDRVHVVGYRPIIGHVALFFGNSDGKRLGRKSGFVGMINRGGKIVELVNHTKSELWNHFKAEKLFTHILRATNGNTKSRQLTEKILQLVKSTIQKTLKENVFQIMLVTPNYFDFRKRALLKECCKEVGFKKITILSEFSLVSYRMFTSLPTPSSSLPDISVLIVSIINCNIGMYVYGCNVSGTNINGVQLISAAFCHFSEENVKSAFDRARAKLGRKERSSIRYYQVFNWYRDGATENIVDAIFRKEKLVKTQIILADNLMDVFAHFSNNPDKISHFLDAFASIPTLVSAEAMDSQVREAPNPTTTPYSAASVSFQNITGPPPKESQSTARSIASTSNATIIQHTTHLSEQLPLQIYLPDREIHNIDALDNWTVRQLRQEVVERLGQSLVLQYNDRLLADDNSLLSFYGLGPDSIIQVAFGKAAAVPVKEAPNDEEISNAFEERTEIIELIGNCVALKNGTEAVEVSGIKLGSLVIARLDLDRLSAGDVRLICKIKGFGDTVYVGVKFRKQLVLGSFDIPIEHVADGRGYCDKCKGRKSLFLPRHQIGKGKLFQVQ